MNADEKIITPAFNLNKYRLTVENDALSATVLWTRVVSSETESLFTQNTRHTFFEVQYALEGRIVITAEDHRFFLDESDFIVIPPDTYHQIIDGDDTGARFILAFSLTGKKNDAAALLRAKGACPHRDSPALRTLVSLIAKKSRGDTPFCGKTLTALIEAFLLELFDLVGVGEEVPDARTLSVDEERVARVLAYIRDHRGVGLTVEGISRRFGLSGRHLNRIFRREQGRSLQEALHREKLAYIEELIAFTTLSLYEIAVLAGFSDEYAMNKFFKRHNRTRPSEYRRTARP